MDFLTIIVVAGLIFIFLSLCGYCCKRQKDGVVISSTTAAPMAPAGYPLAQPPTIGGYPVTVENTPGGFQVTPYPINAQMPMPQLNTGAFNPPYPTHPGVTPMPQPGSYSTQTEYQQNNMPYPPAAVGMNMMNPPPYEQVVDTNLYPKQAPYNPNYIH